MKVAAFFAGVGGIEEGLRRAGKHQTTFFCESDPHASAVLEDRFNCHVVGDIASVTNQDLPAQVDLFTAGFPCQDLSQAGRTAGIRGKKSGVVSHLLELLESRRVPWLFIENVSFMLRLDRGDAMHYLTDSLERLGYAWAYRVVDTRAFGLPQRRERVFLLASRDADPARFLFQHSSEPASDSHEREDIPCGFYWTEGTRGLGWAKNAIPTLKGGSGLGIPSPPAVWLPYGREGYAPEVQIFTPAIEDAEALQGFERGWTQASARVDRRGERARWRLVGNAVSVSAAEWIGELLGNPHELDLPDAQELKSTNSWPRAAFGYGGRRNQVLEATTWPGSGLIDGQEPSLESFLQAPVPLSARATRGFLARFEASSLRKPPGLVDALRSHLDAIEAGAAEAENPAITAAIG